MYGKYVFTFIFFVFASASVSAQVSITQPSSQECASTLGNGTCPECVTRCASAVLLCAATCARRPGQCNACLQKSSSWGGCKTCIPECFSASDPDSVACLSSLPGVLNSTSIEGSTTPANLSSPDPNGPPQIVTIPGWTYRGCWTDSAIDRTLIGKKWKGSLTVRRCAIVCSGYIHFGVEYGIECYCGTTVAHDSIPVPDAWCTSTCSGDNRQICGGSNSLSLYETDKFPTIGTA